MTNDLTTTGADQMEQLMRLAVERGAEGVDALERLVALKERSDALQAQRAFSEALSAFQAECPAIVRSKGIPDSHGKIKFRYAPLEKIVAVAGPIAQSHGLSYRFNTRTEQGGVTAVCILSHVLGHSEESEAFMPTPDIPQTSAAQKAGGAITFAKRTAYCNALGILTADQEGGGAETIPEGGSREPVTAEEAADLEALATEVNANAGAILKWGGAEAWADFPRGKLRAAIKRLEGMRS